MLVLALLTLVTLIVSLIQIRKNQEDLARRQKEINQRIYETVILREIGERIGYQLNLEKILETIIGSLSKLVPYSVVSFMLIDESKSKVNFRLHLEDSVGRHFLDFVRDNMLEKLKEVTTRGYSREDLTESLTGAVVDEINSDLPLSLWVTPLSINSRGRGVLAVASRNPGFYKGSEMAVLEKILAQANRAVSNLEKVIAAEEEKLRAMILAMADGVLLVDRSFNLMFINSAALDFLGLSDPKVTIFEVVGKLSDKLDLRAKIEESQRQNNLVTFDNLTIGKKVSRVMISPVKSSHQDFIGTVVLFHDVTSQKELEGVREDFTAMMVHELRAPLTVVRGAIDMFLRDLSLPAKPEGQDLLKTMQSSTATMLSLVNDLLDVAKIDAGKFQVTKALNDISGVIHDEITFFTELAMPKSITINSDCQTGLTANFDKERISQVLNNLLSNAIKFTPLGGKVTVSAYKINTSEEIKWRYLDFKPVFSGTLPALVVSVADTGQGIPEGRIPELFYKFKQLKPADDHGGTGLGLVVAKGIVQSHGGSIFVQSRVGEGSTFFFTLPVGPEPVEGLTISK